MPGACSSGSSRSAPGPRSAPEILAATALGDAFTYDGPTLLTLFALYKPTTDAKAVTAAVQEEAERIAREGVPAEELARVKTKMRADFYDQMELPLNRANALAIAQAFTGKAQSAVEVPAQIDAVTSDDLKRVAATYLTVNNRTVIDRVPAAAKRPAAPPAGGSK